MRLHFKLADAGSFSWPGLVGKSYSEKENFSRASAARFWVDTHHGRVSNKESDRVYLVLAGSGWFEVNEDRFEVQKDDVIIVPKMTPYDYGGKMELFLVHTPAYDQSNERSEDAGGRTQK